MLVWYIDAGLGLFHSYLKFWNDYDDQQIRGRTMLISISMDICTPVSCIGLEVKEENKEKKPCHKKMKKCFHGNQPKWCFGVEFQGCVLVRCWSFQISSNHFSQLDNYNYILITLCLYSLQLQLHINDPVSLLSTITY